MHTIIAGSRHFHDYATLEAAIRFSGFTITRVISGEAEGVDQLGERWARDHGLAIHQCPADWKKHGRAAGPIRNKQMANIGEALIALPCPCSKGTHGMIRFAREKGILVFVYEVSCGIAVSSRQWGLF